MKSSAPYLTTSSKLGIKVRRNPDYNYESIWFNLKTYRLGEGESRELPPTKAEFYDVAYKMSQVEKCL